MFHSTLQTVKKCPEDVFFFFSFAFFGPHFFGSGKKGIFCNKVCSVCSNRNMTGPTEYTEDDKVRVFIGSIPPSANSEDVRNFFADQGWSDLEVNVLTDKRTGGNKGKRFLFLFCLKRRLLRFLSFVLFPDPLFFCFVFVFV